LIFYYLSRPLVHVNILFSKLTTEKPNLLKKIQYRIVLSILKKKKIKTFLEFGSGASTLFFLKKYNYLNFSSVNMLKEKKYTDVVRQKLLEEKKYDTSGVSILDLRTNIKKIGNNVAVQFIGNFNIIYDFIYIDGPSNLERTNLIYNILNYNIKSLNYFFDGRYNFANSLVLSLKKKNIPYKLRSSALFNYTYINITNENFIKS
jgi:hypothetical protein